MMGTLNRRKLRARLPSAGSKFVRIVVNVRLLILLTNVGL